MTWLRAAATIRIMATQSTLLVLSPDADLRSSALRFADDRSQVVFFDDAAEALSAGRKLAVAVFLVDARERHLLTEGLVRRIRQLPSAPQLLILPPEDEALPAQVMPDEIHLADGREESLRNQVRRLLRFHAVRTRSGIVGSTTGISELLNTIVQVGPLDVPVLIQGESGTGKELVARALHDESPRRDLPFVSVNVGSLPETLLESELFGHEKGAFTGAVARREGVFERANRGTLFLDEVGEMPPAMQVKLLRVLESNEYQRVGGNQTLSTDVRLLAATHRSLEEEMKAGRFRGDLYYRLKVIKVEIPPLRDRYEDIPLLVQSFLTAINARHGLHRKGLTRDAMERLVRYAWPGNVRELRNVVASMAVLGTSDYLGVDDLPEELVTQETGQGVMPVPVRLGSNGREGDSLLTSTLLSLMTDLRRVNERLDRIETLLGRGSHETGAGAGSGPGSVIWDDAADDAEFTPVAPDLPQDLAGAERTMIEASLRQHRGNRRRAAEQLGISERTLYRKLKAYGL